MENVGAEAVSEGRGGMVKSEVTCSPYPRSKNTQVTRGAELLTSFYHLRTGMIQDPKLRRLSLLYSNNR
jgi:hypothetical protein